MWKRTTAGVVVLLLLYGVYRIDSNLRLPYLSAAMAALIGLVGVLEFHRLLRIGGRPGHAWLGGLFVAFLLLGKAALLVTGAPDRWLAEGLLLGLLFCSFLLEILRGEPEGAPERVANGLLGMLMIVAFSHFLDLLLRPQAPLGLGVTFLVLLTAKATDMGGYLVGNWVGGRKLAPRVSPGKTWSGAVGGLALAMLVAVYGFHLLGGSVGVFHALLFGLLVGIAAQLGDLAESLLKRSCGSKDSSAWIPTFGGVLDLIDSLVLAAPVGYWMLVWLLGLPA